MDNPIKIIKIIDEYNVVINAGKQRSIHEDDILEVYETGIEVIDPETNASLGTLDFIKAKLRVKDSYPKMAVCENRDGELERTLADAMTITFTKKVPLNVETKEISGGFENRSKKIKIGDLVRKV